MKLKIYSHFQLILILGLVLISSIARCQYTPFPKKSAVWKHYQTYQDGPNRTETIIYYEYISNLEIDSTKYKLIAEGFPPYSLFLIYDDTANERVYFRFPYQLMPRGSKADSNYVFYDFSLNPGEYLDVISKTTVGDNRWYVTDTGRIFLNGANRKFLDVYSDSMKVLKTDRWIEFW